MKNSLSKGEKIILVASSVLVILFISVFSFIKNRKSVSVSQFETLQPINYKMNRPEEAYSEYNLSGREWDESYEALEKKDLEKLNKRKKELLAKQKEEDKKKQNKKKSDLALKKATKSQEEQSLKAEKLYSYDDDESSQVAYAKKSNSSERDGNANVSYVVGNNQNTNQPDSTAPAKKQDNKKTLAEWKSLIMASPTSENLGLLVAALHKSEITSADFQSLVKDLLASSDQKHKGLGLMALRTIPSAFSLAQLAHSEASIGETLQSYHEQAMNAYLLPQNLEHVSGVLLSKDKLVVTRVLGLLNLNLPKINQGDFSFLIDPRHKRDNTSVGTLSMSSYSSLLPVLAQMTAGQDAEIASLAGQVASLIQSSNNVAIN